LRKQCGLNKEFWLYLHFLDWYQMNSQTYREHQRDFRISQSKYDHRYKINK